MKQTKQERIAELEVALEAERRASEKARSEAEAMRKAMIRLTEAARLDQAKADVQRKRALVAAVNADHHLSIIDESYQRLMFDPAKFSAVAKTLTEAGHGDLLKQVVTSVVVVPATG